MPHKNKKKTCPKQPTIKEREYLKVQLYGDFTQFIIVTDFRDDAAFNFTLPVFEIVCQIPHISIPSFAYEIEFRKL